MSGRIVDSILMVEFHDSFSRNSFSIRAAEELKAICEAERGRYTGVVFSAHGRVFCSGGNLADYASATSADPGLEINRRITAVLNDFSKLPVPTVCVIHGDCFGGGLELISAFDVVLCVPGALFGFWQRKIGLSFGWGGGTRLERRLGEQRLRQFALKAATFGSQEAHRVGLIDGIYLEYLIMDEAAARVRKMARLPKKPVEVIKALTPENEQASFEKLWWSEEHRAVLSKYRS